MKTILETVFGGKTPMPTEEDKPEFKQNKKYRLCVEDNPNEQKYGCGTKQIVHPNCKLSLQLEELTSDEVGGLATEIRALIEKHGFVLR